MAHLPCEHDTHQVRCPDRRNPLNTFWNMRQFFADEWKHDIPQPVHGPPSEGAAIRVVCVRADIPIDFQYYNVDAHVEGINQVIAEEYKSLFEYQLAKRLRRGR